MLASDDSLQTPLQELRKLTNNEYSDFVLLKFLKARDNNVTKALTMITNYKTWRQTAKVDELHSFRYSEHDAVHQIYPRIWHKTDKLGRPVWIKFHDRISIDALLKVTNQERFVKHHIRENEKLQNYRLEACSLAKGERVSQVVLIMDLKGFPLMEVARGLSLLKEIAQIDADYYPEMLGKIVVINANMFFSTVWGMIKGVLPKETVEKITILGKGYYSELKELIDDDNIPESLGGKSVVTSPDLGPWNDGSASGYPISEFEDYVKLDQAGEVVVE